MERELSRLVYVRTVGVSACMTEIPSQTNVNQTRPVFYYLRFV